MLRSSVSVYPLIVAILALTGCAGSANHRVLAVQQERDNTMTCQEISSEKRKAQAIISAVERDKEDYSGDDIIDGLLWFPFNVIAKQSNYSSATNAAEARIDHLSSLEAENGCKALARNNVVNERDITSQLKTLNTAYKSNLLTKEEYLSKREKVLEQVDSPVKADNWPSSNSNSNTSHSNTEKMGTWSYKVEHYAMVDSCTPSSGATVVSKQDFVEFYKVSCQDGRTFIFRCENQACSKQQ